MRKWKAHLLVCHWPVLESHALFWFSGLNSGSKTLFLLIQERGSHVSKGEVWVSSGSLLKVDMTKTYILVVLIVLPSNEVLDHCISSWWYYCKKYQSRWQTMVSDSVSASFKPGRNQAIGACVCQVIIDPIFLRIQVLFSLFMWNMFSCGHGNTARSSLILLETVKLFTCGCTLCSLVQQWLKTGWANSLHVRCRCSHHTPRVMKHRQKYFLEQYKVHLYLCVTLQ